MKIHGFDVIYKKESLKDSNHFLVENFFNQKLNCQKCNIELTVEEIANCKDL